MAVTAPVVPCKTITDIKVSGYPTQISERFRYPFSANLLIFDLQKNGQIGFGGGCFSRAPGSVGFAVLIILVWTQFLSSRGDLVMTDKECGLPHILVANDYSLESRAAADAALQIARIRDLAIQGLYVVEEVLALDTYANYHAELSVLSNGSNAGGREPTSRAELVSWFENQGKLALHWLETVCAEAGVPVTTKLLAGGVSELILRDAAQARLLAIGRRGISHKDDLESLGHNFRKIAHHAHLPILVGGSKTPTLHRLLLAYNGQAHANEALAWTAKLQRDLSAEVIVLSVCEDTESGQCGVSLEEAENRLVHSDLTAYRFLPGQGRPAVEMAAAAVANDVDLIILGHYRHSAPVEWLVGSTVDRLLRTTALPVLIA
jgi:nucleotide-binding universal stress UspA family protein